jgi:hypothetical protein
MDTSLLGKAFQCAIVAGFITTAYVAYWRKPPESQTIICAVHMMKLGLMQTAVDYANADKTTKRCIIQLDLR